jgi:hypothetical protein
MGRVEVVLSDELELKLRQRALTDYGGRKGSLGEAVTAAITAYVNPEIMSNLERIMRDPTADDIVTEGAARALARSGEPGAGILVRIASEWDARNPWARKIAAGYLEAAIVNAAPKRGPVPVLDGPASE